MLLVYHVDKNDTHIEDFFNEELRLELGFFPRQNTRVKLKLVGFSNDTEGGIVYMRFPDLIGGDMEEVLGDYTDAYEVPGLAIGADEGSFVDGNGAIMASNYGRYASQTDTRIFDLDLGRVDTQKDYFRVVVDARRGTDKPPSGSVPTPRINLNNFSCILEMSDGNATT